MSVSTSTSKVSHTLTTGSQALTVPFRFLANSHIKAIKAGDTPLTLVEGTDYTLTGAGASSGTLTTIATTPNGLTAGSVVVIKRNVPLTQETSYTYNGDFPSTVQEAVEDKLTMIAQQVKEQSDRALHFPEDDTTSAELPSKVDRSNTVQGYDANGAPAIYTATGGTNTYRYQAITVAAAKATSYASFANNEQIFLSGYYAAGDGGGGPLYVDKADATTADNGGTVFVASDGTRLKRANQKPNVVELTDFGASSAQSAVTNNAALNAAFSAAALLTTGGIGATVMVSGGLAFSGSFTLPDRVKIQGDGSRTTILSYSGSSTFLTIDSTTHNGISGVRISLGSSSSAVGIEIKTTSGDAMWGRYNDLEIAASSVTGQKGMDLHVSGGHIISENNFSNINFYCVDQPITNIGTEGNFFHGITIGVFGVSSACSGVLSQSFANQWSIRIAGGPASGSIAFQENGDRNIIDVAVDIGSASSAVSISGTANIVRLVRPEALTPIGLTNKYTVLIDGDTTATETTWNDVTLNSGWTNAFGAPKPVVGYIKRLGVVYFRGGISGGSGTIFTLPTGYRPSAELVFPVYANAAITRLVVATNGDVSLASGTPTAITLDGISFSLT